MAHIVTVNKPKRKRFGIPFKPCIAQRSLLGHNRGDLNDHTSSVYLIFLNAHWGTKILSQIMQRTFSYGDIPLILQRLKKIQYTSPYVIWNGQAPSTGWFFSEIVGFRVGDAGASDSAGIWEMVCDSYICLRSSVWGAARQMKFANNCEMDHNRGEQF